MAADDFDAAYQLHKEHGWICFVNPAMGIYFLEDPDGYWIEIVCDGSYMEEEDCLLPVSGQWYPGGAWRYSDIRQDHVFLDVCRGWDGNGRSYGSRHRGNEHHGRDRKHRQDDHRRADLLRGPGSV